MKNHVSFLLCVLLENALLLKSASDELHGVDYGSGHYGVKQQCPRGSYATGFK